MDDFYDPLPVSRSGHGAGPESSGMLSYLWNFLLAAPPLPTLIILLVTPLTVILATRLLSERPSVVVQRKNGGQERSKSAVAKSVWLLPYWIPGIGHALSFLWDPVKLMSELRDLSAHGIFALRLGPTTHNIISDPHLVKGVMQQRESVANFQPIAWNVVEKFFDFPRSSKAKYEADWEEFNKYSEQYLMREPSLGSMMRRTVKGLEENVPQMISFMESDIDHQPWERWAEAEYISNTETEINLMSLMRDMLGNASVPALYGKAYMEQFPDILHNIYDMDAGMVYFLMGLPRWTPYPGVIKAHIARSRVWHSLVEYHKALDATVDNLPLDSAWGDLDDVSEFEMARHKLFKERGFNYDERGDISILWALLANAPLLTYWQIHHILAVPDLVSRIREEIAPYAVVHKPLTIGSISELPKLTISHEGLSKNCPLLKSTYLEALRTSSQPWSVRQMGAETYISTGNKETEYVLREGEYVTMPHDLHMRDAKYFAAPEKFDPERFLVRNEDGSLSTDMQTMRPYGGGPSMCKGRQFAERECLSLVAGVLAYWDIEPADEKIGWKIPKQKKTTAVSLPVHDTRVRIKRRKFEWEV